MYNPENFDFTNTQPSIQKYLYPKTINDNYMANINLKLTTKDYMFLGIIGALCFVLAFSLGTIINSATGIPMTGGIINGLVVGIVIIIGLKIFDKFGSATVLWIVFSVFASATTTMGPPGIYKIPLGIIVGLVLDIIISISNKKDIGYILGGASMSVTNMFGVYVAMYYLSMPGLDMFKKYLVYLVFFYSILGAFSAWLGLLLYKSKIQNLEVINQMKS